MSGYASAEGNARPSRTATAAVVSSGCASYSRNLGRTRHADLRPHSASARSGRARRGRNRIVDSFRLQGTTVTVHTGQQSSRSVFDAGLPTIAYHDAKPDDAHRTIRQARQQAPMPDPAGLAQPVGGGDRVASQERCKSSDVDSAHLQF